MMIGNVKGIQVTRNTSEAAPFVINVARRGAPLFERPRLALSSWRLMWLLVTIIAKHAIWVTAFYTTVKRCVSRKRPVVCLRTRVAPTNRTHIIYTRT